MLFCIKKCKQFFRAPKPGFHGVYIYSTVAANATTGESGWTSNTNSKLSLLFVEEASRHLNQSFKEWLCVLLCLCPSHQPPTVTGQFTAYALPNEICLDPSIPEPHSACVCGLPVYVRSVYMRVSSYRSVVSLKTLLSLFCTTGVWSILCSILCSIILHLNRM